MEQLLDVLDGLFADGPDLTRRQAIDPWEQIFTRPDHPFNSDLPDVNLLDWREAGLLPGGEGLTAMDIGCGLGRNTRWLARQGDRATGVDISAFANTQARNRTAETDATFLESDFLREAVPRGPFDLVYDSGCFHHLPPHRGLSCLWALRACLKPGGLFGICTFAAGKMGSDADDLTLFKQSRLAEGLGYGADELKAIFPIWKCWRVARCAHFKVRPNPPSRWIFSAPLCFAAHSSGFSISQGRPYGPG
ncbi:class I SAM-dependent methyltransferase [Deinococcus aerolatus]|uniref:class I SAM-dependent methyltransferase n=1 Tax=Deinococcus aerolatus TaxID=522487 RepID=UPI001E37A1A6|nr:class I SAM-dependent methyltransferase [Deinococcus aerolatus]